MTSPEADFWKKKPDVIEVFGLDEKNTLTVIERLPPNVEVLSGKFVYKKKMYVDGSIKKYKVQYVV